MTTHYELFGDNLGEQTGKCDCGGASPGGSHDPMCGWLLVGPIGEIVAAYDAQHGTVADLTERLVAASSEWDDNTGDDEGPTSRPYLEHLARAVAQPGTVMLPADWRDQLRLVKNGAVSSEAVAKTIALVESWRPVPAEAGDSTAAVCEHDPFAFCDCNPLTESQQKAAAAEQLGYCEGSDPLSADPEDGEICPELRRAGSPYCEGHDPTPTRTGDSTADETAWVPKLGEMATGTRAVGPGYAVTGCYQGDSKFAGESALKVDGDCLVAVETASLRPASSVRDTAAGGAR